jgi:hypothetical protein
LSVFDSNFVLLTRRDKGDFGEDSPGENDDKEDGGNDKDDDGAGDCGPWMMLGD